MKKLLVSAVAVSVLVSAAGIASAQPGPRSEGRQEQSRDARGNDNRREAQNDNRYERRAERRYSAGRYQAPRGYQARQWRRGDKLPTAYRGRSYVVDHRKYGLGAPPKGHQYVRVGNDVVLTAVASGVIASVITQIFQ